MKVAMVTDSPNLCEETMYLNQLKKEMEGQGTTMDLVAVMASQWGFLEGKVPIQRMTKTSLIIPAIRRYDLVHVQFTFPLGFLLTLLHALHGKPTIIHTHGDDVFVVPSAGIGFRRSPVGRLLTWITWEATSRIIAVCERAREEIMKANIPGSKISVLYNGVNADFFSRRTMTENEKLAIVGDNSDFVFLTVGNLKEVKNQMRLLAAFSLFAKEFNGDSKLIVCGGGRLKETLCEIARKLNIKGNVVFLGKVPHYKMPEVYSVADAYILPSLHEAHPWSLLEAMSCELPAAASRVGGIPETLNNERLLFDPWKIHEISRAMLLLAENPKRSKHVGMQNREIVLQRFTLKHHAAQLQSIYAEVLQS